MLLSDCLKKSQELYWQSLKVPYFEVSKCKLICTNILSPWLNGVVSADFLRQEDVSPAVATIAEYFKSKNLPFSWWMETAYEPKNFAEEAKKQGIECLGTFDGMVLNLDRLKEIPLAVNLEIQLVSSPESLRQFVAVLIEAYEAEKEIAPHVESLFAKAGLKSPIFHFLGKVEGKPVTVGSLFVEEGMAGIYHIGTTPEARGKGYATTLTYRALKQAQEAGCSASFLTSTPMANQIYQNLGYETLSAFNFYVGM